MNNQSIKYRKQIGFTLIELLVVVSILAVISMIVVVQVDGYELQAEKQLAYTDMKRIAKAIYRFKADTGYFPKEGSFEATASLEENNLDFLFSSPMNGSSEISPWNVDAGIGWNGPYLTFESAQKLYVYPGSGDNYCASPPITNNIVIGLEDTFISLGEYPVQDLTASPPVTGYQGDCFALHNNGLWAPKELSGQPYRYLLAFENNSYSDCPVDTPIVGCLALISSGPNGLFENGNGDDIVKILRVNN